MELHRLAIDENNFFLAGTRMGEKECIFVDLNNDKAFQFKWDLRQAQSNTSKSAEEIESWLEQVVNSSSEFVFSLEEGDQLVWKKVGGKSKLRIATFDALPIDKQSAQNSLFGRALEVQSEMKVHRDNFYRISEERKDYQVRIERMIKDKNDLEENLFSRFLPILHSKQDKIRELQEQLKGVKPTKVHSVSSSSDESMSQEESSQPQNSTLDFNNSQNFLNL